jgi:hypothetical protein
MKKKLDSKQMLFEMMVKVNPDLKLNKKGNVSKKRRLTEDVERNYEYYMTKERVDNDYIQWLSREFSLLPETVRGVAEIEGYDPEQTYMTLDDEVERKGYGFDTVEEYDGDIDDEDDSDRNYDIYGNIKSDEISEEMEAGGNSPINKFVMFGFNFPPNFISEVWADNQNIANHLQEKFSSIYDRNGAKAAVFVFYTELDTENKRKFEDWVTQNYKG